MSEMAIISWKQRKWKSCFFKAVSKLWLSGYPRNKIEHLRRDLSFHMYVCHFINRPSKISVFFVEWNFGKEIFNCSRHLCWTLYSPYMREKPRARSNWLDIDRVLFSNLKSQNQTLT